ncbi:MAG: hypothetical protein GF313_06425 [Caldithrix sp.]|nr:hypothetical protein [Caldithrix sp.]
MTSPAVTPLTLLRYKTNHLAASRNGRGNRRLVVNTPVWDYFDIYDLINLKWMDLRSLLKCFCHAITIRSVWITGSTGFNRLTGVSNALQVTESYINLSICDNRIARHPLRQNHFIK